MKRKLASLLITTMLILGVIAVAIPTAQAFDCKLKVEPAAIHKWSDVDHVGDTFTVTITIYDVPDQNGGFYGWEFWLSWTPGVINCTLETLNTGIWSAYSIWVSEPIDNVAGTYHQSMTARAPAVPKTGTWLLVTLTFKIVAPAPYMGVVSTALHLSPPEGATYCIADKNTVQIPHDFEDGLYVYHWAPPTLYPHLEVEYTGEPGVHEKTFSGKNIYKTPFQFSIDVVIKDVDAGWRLAGTQFLLLYNTTILDVLDVTVGGPSGFFESFTDPPGGTWTFSDVDEAAGKIRIAYIIFDIPHMIPPYGDGFIARITFNATYQEKFPASVSSDFILEIDTEAGATSFFANYLADELPYEDPINGKYTLAGYVIGRVIDVFTQYPDPYGGQGPGAPSDMFWPQKEVILYAKVTYNEWPVQQKPVAFEVRNPYGTIMTILTGVTNETGEATVSFRMNWPCENPEDLFGVWTIVATVDIACIVVNDTLQFHYDYLVHWTSVTVNKDPAEYAHCEEIVITVNFVSHSMMERWVYIAATLHDELNYPAITGTVAEYVKLFGAQWCTPKSYTVTFRIHVDKSVAAGEATIHVSALTNPPYANGCALCPEITKKVSIKS